MTIFCTQCGSKNLDHARFCEACGTPMKAAAAEAAPLNTALPIAKPKRNKIIAFALIGVSALVLLGGLAYLLTPESPSEASFTRATDRYLDANPKFVEKRTCLTNMPYERSPLRVSSASTQKWMDALVQSGLYAPPQLETSSSFFYSQTISVYSVTDAGKEAIKNGKLCLAKGLRVKGASGYDNIRDKNRGTVRANLELLDEAAWLAKSPAREYILEDVDLENIEFVMPIRLIDKKWQIDESPRQDLDGLLGQRDPVARTAPSSNFFATIKQWFSFNSNPLIGRWQDPTGLFTFEFTSDQLIVGPIAQSAQYEVKGDLVTVTTEERPILIKVIDQDTISMDIGIGEVRMKRLQP